MTGGAGLMPGPLSGTRVLDLSNLLAGPMVAMYLADFGADVIKVEMPRVGDEMRRWGYSKNGVPLLFQVVNRNKRGITLDLHAKKGQEIARALARRADVIVESFRPGTLEKWGLGYSDLAAENPGLVLARVTGFGQDGPYAGRRGFGTTGEALSGVAHVTGYPGREPILPSYGLGDTTTAIFGAFAVVLALLHRERSGGRGQVVDLGLYEGLVTLLGSHIVDYDQLGIVQPRTGSRLPFAAPRNVYQSKDRQWIALAGSTQRAFEAIMNALDLGHLTAESRFLDNASRLLHVDELDAAIGSRVAELDITPLMTRMMEKDAPASRIYSVEDLANDPHVGARGNLTTVCHPELGPMRMQNVFPRLDLTPGAVRTVGPQLGADNLEVFQELGMTHQDLETLEREGVV